MEVVNVKVKYIRPFYNNLKEWMDDNNNIYIGRKGVVFIDKVRYPKYDSIWANPFKITEENDRDAVVKQYKKYIVNKIKKDDLIHDLLQLKGKKLGCWCKENDKKKYIACHGDVLVELINLYEKEKK